MFLARATQQDAEFVEVTDLEERRQPQALAFDARQAYWPDTSKFLSYGGRMSTCLVSLLSSLGLVALGAISCILLSFFPLLFSLRHFCPSSRISFLISSLFYLDCILFVFSLAVSVSFIFSPSLCDAQHFLQNIVHAQLSSSPQPESASDARSACLRVPTASRTPAWHLGKKMHFC